MYSSGQSLVLLCFHTYGTMVLMVFIYKKKTSVVVLQMADRDRSVSMRLEDNWQLWSEKRAQQQIRAVWKAP